jgi:hypothetical protein
MNQQVQLQKVIDDDGRQNEHVNPEDNGQQTTISSSSPLSTGRGSPASEFAECCSGMAGSSTDRAF